MKSKATGPKPHLNDRNLQMLARYLSGYSMSQISEEFKTSHSNVSRIAARDNWKQKYKELVDERFHNIKYKNRDMASRVTDIMEENVRRIERDFKKHKNKLTDQESTFVRLTAQFLRNENRLDDDKPTQNVNNMGVVKQVFHMPEGMTFPGVFDYSDKVEIVVPSEVQGKGGEETESTLEKAKRIMEQLPPPPEPKKMGAPRKKREPKPVEEKKSDENT